MSQDALGAEIPVSGSQIGHYESGRSVPSEAMADALDRILDAGGKLQDAANTARGEAVAPWLRPWSENEERAISLRTWEHSIVPGLLQTEEYARSVFGTGWHSPDQAEEAVRTRLARQAAALDRPEPVELTAIMGEVALRQGEASIMKDQLEHLVDIGHRPNVHVRVMPISAGMHAGIAGAFAIATLPDGSTVVYLDDLVEGKIGNRARDMRRAVTAWEGVCANTLPCEMSRDLILKAIDHHETELAQEQPKQ